MHVLTKEITGDACGGWRTLLYPSRHASDSAYSEQRQHLGPGSRWIDNDPEGNALALAFPRSPLTEQLELELRVQWV